MALTRLGDALRAPLRLTRAALLWGLLLLLVLVFVPLIVTTSRWLPALRVDLTSDHLYTLTPGTVSIVQNLRRPLRLTLYFSEHATRDLPQLRSYEQRVNEMLQEMVARSHGQLHLKVIDPVPYSDDETSAEGSGLTSASGGTNGERVFFGLAASVMRAGEDGAGEMDVPALRTPERSLAIPFFDPAREAFVEYDIAKLLYELNQRSKPTIDVISSLPVDGGGDPALGDQPWTVMQQLGQLFRLHTIEPDKLTHIGPHTKVVLLIHPQHLSTAAQYAIDQYVLGGGHLVVFVDPDAEMDFAPSSDDPANPPDPSSNLPRLFAAWGVVYNPHEVVLDRSLALQIELAGSSLSHPAMLGLGTRELNRNDVVTASLQRINVSTMGHFDLAPRTRSRLIPLLQSSDQAELASTSEVIAASSDPGSLLQGYKPDGAQYVLAARLRGPFNSAFPERAGEKGHLSTSVAGAEIILVADTDLLSDRLWIETPNILGQTMKRAFANNGDFVSNLADSLSGSSALLSIRGRSTSQRPFTRVQALRHVADQKFLQKETELEQELADTRHRLEELQPAKGQNRNTVTAEQHKEIEQFRQRQLAIIQELRNVQHRLNAEIDALGLRLKFINIVVVPALVILIGLLYGWRRLRRGRQRS